MLSDKATRINVEWGNARPRAWDKNWHGGERKMLYDLLDNDENIERLIGGTFRADTNRLHQHRGVTVATSKRVIFLDKGMFGSTEVQEMLYGSIEAITYSTGMFYAGVQITGRGRSSFRIEDIPEKKSVQPFVSCVRIHMEAVSNPANPTGEQPQHAVSVADEIEKFGRLLESGILTQEEFDAKKKQLLGF